MGEVYDIATIDSQNDNSLLWHSDQRLHFNRDGSELVVIAHAPEGTPDAEDFGRLMSADINVRRDGRGIVYQTIPLTNEWGQYTGSRCEVDPNSIEGIAAQQNAQLEGLVKQ